MDWKIVDSEMTPWRTKIKDLQIERGIGSSEDYSSEGCFHCEHWECCYASIRVRDQYKKNKVIKGDWTYVGYQYGNKALVNGKKAKILFVSMSRGYGYGTKYEEFEHTQTSFRNSAYCPKNKHMMGVKGELEHLLDEASPENRCQQFALTNSVRCRHPPKSGGPMKYNATPTMEKNCASHTKAIIQALEPDIIIAQGTNPRKSMCKLFKTESVYYNKQTLSAEIRRGEGILFLLTAHPAAPHYYRFNWKNGNLPGELKKVFKRAREIYSGTVDSKKNVEGAMREPPVHDGEAIKESINTFELCGDRPEALNRRVILLLNELANERTLEVKDESYLYRPGKIAERVGMEVKAKNLRITLAPADTVTQAREFFCKVDKEDFLSLEESSEWTVRPNLHFSYMRACI